MTGKVQPHCRSELRVDVIATAFPNKVGGGPLAKLTEISAALGRLARVELVPIALAAGWLVRRSPGACRVRPGLAAAYLRYVDGVQVGGMLVLQALAGRQGRELRTGSPA
jgi:hypothetical protein